MYNFHYFQTRRVQQNGIHTVTTATMCRRGDWIKPERGLNVRLWVAI